MNIEYMHRMWAIMFHRNIYSAKLSVRILREREWVRGRDWGGQDDLC